MCMPWFFVVELHALKKKTGQIWKVYRWRQSYIHTVQHLSESSLIHFYVLKHKKNPDRLTRDCCGRFNRNSCAEIILWVAETFISHLGFLSVYL